MKRPIELSSILAVIAVFGLGGCARKEANLPQRMPAKPRLPAKVRAPQPKTAVLTPKIVYCVRTRQKVFALTFDDGPHPLYTPQVLAVLKKRHVAATFFMVGSMVGAHPQTVLLVQRAGFPIENHSWSHPRTPRFPILEIERTNAILKKVLGIRPSQFRPPYGLLRNGMADAALKRGENVVVWSSLGADWDKKSTPQSIAAKVLRHASPGGIALLHDGSGNRSATIAALPLIIDTLRARDYRLVTVPQLLLMGAPISTPPFKFKSAKSSKG